MSKELRTSYIIHIFALLHALVAAFCLWTDIDNELLLTVLTMTLTVIICQKHHLSIESSAIFMILVNIAGYFIGTSGGKLLGSFLESRMAIDCIATAATTEILGWISLLVASIIRKEDTKESAGQLDRRLRWIITAVVIIFTLRIVYATFLSSNRFTHATILYILREILSDSATMITTIGLNVIFIGYTRKFKNRFRQPVKGILLTVFLVAMTALAALITNITIFNKAYGFTGLSFFQVASVMFMVELTIYCIIYLIFSALWSRQQMNQAREKANWEKYRYLRLKQQVNPHFLFNSLNILDCLVCEEKTEQASTYIHKLAGIYRYFLRNEDNPVIPLKDEITFTNLYLDLLEVRFQDGFEVTWEIPEECLNRHIIPCSLQMLVENAFKHNTVLPENPLTIRITADGNYLSISNKLIPKCKDAPSTGLGQKYIRQQYEDITGKTVVFEQTETTYTVKLPLL